MEDGSPESALERVARLEIENESLRRRIARARRRAFQEDTVSTRRPGGGRLALSLGVGIAFGGALVGIAASLTARAAAPVPYLEPPPAIAPLPPTPPVYAEPSPHAAGREHRVVEVR